MKTSLNMQYSPVQLHMLRVFLSPCLTPLLDHSICNHQCLQPKGALSSLVGTCGHFFMTFHRVINLQTSTPLFAGCLPPVGAQRHPRGTHSVNHQRSFTVDRKYRGTGHGRIFLLQGSVCVHRDSDTLKPHFQVYNFIGSLPEKVQMH